MVWCIHLYLLILAWMSWTKLARSNLFRSFDFCQWQPAKPRTTVRSFLWILYGHRYLKHPSRVEHCHKEEPEEPGYTSILFRFSCRCCLARKMQSNIKSIELSEQVCVCVCVCDCVPATYPVQQHLVPEHPNKNWPHSRLHDPWSWVSILEKWEMHSCAQYMDVCLGLGRTWCIEKLAVKMQKP